MKFESKCGIGEICILNDDVADNKRKVDDLLVRVIGVIFSEGKSPEYIVEHIGRQFGVQRLTVAESRLLNDPDFDQETGKVIKRS